MPAPVGLLGGTFDPVHHGHLRLAVEAREQAGLEEVRLMPLHGPPHRDPPEASPEDRLEMLRLAVDGVAGLEVEECELQRGGRSYTSDTLRELQARQPDRPLCLILGLDAFSRLHTWHEWRSIPRLAHLILAGRPGQATGIDHPEVAGLYEQAASGETSGLRQAVSGSILAINIPLLEISATRIRGMIAAGQDPHYLLPAAVLDFIRARDLYKMRTR